MGIALPPAEPAAPSARARQWTVALIVNLAAVCGGTAVSWSAPTLPILQAEAEDVGAWAGTWPQALLPARALSNTEGSLVAALVPLGALAGALPAGALVRRVGMRRPLLGLAVLFTVGWVLILLAGCGGVVMILLGRAVHGVATGAATVLVPRYSDEMAEVAIRGALGSLLDLSMCNGVLLVYVLALGLPYGLLTIVAAVVPFLFAVTFFFMPESPVYLAKAGRRKEALESLASLRPGWSQAALEVELATLTAENLESEMDAGKVLTSAPPSPQAETPPPQYEKVVPPIPQSAPTSEDGDKAAEETTFTPTPTPNDSSPPLSSSMALAPPAFESVRHRSPHTATDPPSPMPETLPTLSTKSSKRPNVLPMQQDILPPTQSKSSTDGTKATKKRFSSITVKGIFISYMLMFLQQTAAISAVIAYATQIFAEAGGALSPQVSTVLLGVLQSAGGVAAALLVERAGRRPLLVGSSLVAAATLAALAFTSSDAVPWLPPIALGLYIAAFEMGLGPLPWFIAAELVGPTAGGGAVAVNWATAAVVTESFPGLARHFGQRAVFGAFSVMALVAVVFSLILVPETRGKSRAQLKEELRMWPRRALRCTSGVV